MLENIKNDGGNLDKWISKAKDKEDSFRLMGFGHRVYKNFDPRAKIIKKAAVLAAQSDKKKKGKTAYEERQDRKEKKKKN